MILTETRDQALLRSFFERDPIGRLYQWGDLAEPHFEQTRWFAAIDGASVQALLLLFTALETPALLPSGADGPLAKLFERFAPDLPPRFYTKLGIEQEALFAAQYDLQAPIALHVMGLDRFHPRIQPPRTLLRRLSATQPLKAIERLYRDYPGNFFEPSQLRHGLYVGAWLNGRLASVAGTHALAPDEGIAAIGNIVTGADYRGKGLCQATVSFLVRELRKERCRHIGLHVEQNNAAAIACYEQIGFRIHSQVHQFLAVKRGVSPRAVAG